MPPWLGGQKEDTVCGQVAGGKKKNTKTRRLAVVISNTLEDRDAVGRML